MTESNVSALLPQLSFKDTLLSIVGLAFVSVPSYVLLLIHTDIVS